MSNVLIGIIGVILFIGLALAGALFLGPRFQESVNNSKASASVQAVAQLAAAVNMYNVDTGSPLKANAEETLVPDFLKDIPGNPVVANRLPIAVASNGTSTNPALDAYFIAMPIGTNQAVCDAIARQSGEPGGVAPAVTTVSTAFVTRVSGCVKSATALAGSTAGDYVVYSRI